MTIEMKAPTSTLSAHIINARISYKRVPIHVLEKFAFTDIDAAHREFINAGFSESIIIQTCNRVEIFATSADPDDQRLRQAWSGFAKLSAKDVAEVEIESGKVAVGHLMRLASGLDSLVVGEDQILGQVKRAFMLADSKGFSGPILNAIFDKAVKIGSRVRSRTGISKGNVSIASVAISLAQEYFDDISAKKIMLVGTGQAATLVAKILKNQLIEFFITSRTPERAKWFADNLSGIPVPFDNAVEKLSDMDIIFVATTAPYLLLTFERMQKALEVRSNRPLIILDLSNPRTVDDKVSSIQGVKLINLDQIAELANKNLRSRMKEFTAAEKMIEHELKSVDLAMNRMKAEPLVNSVFKEADRIRELELSRALAALGRAKLSKRELSVLDQLSHAIVEGILSPPMNNLRKEISATGREDLLMVIGQLFKYEHDSKTD